MDLPSTEECDEVAAMYGITRLPEETNEEIEKRIFAAMAGIKNEFKISK